MTDNRSYEKFREKYKMNSATNQAIVDGILQGYKNYLDERREKKEKMYISSAYAWVRGNHLEDQTARECEELNVRYDKAKAGYSWGYLQFKIEDEKRMFIIRNGKYLNKEDYSSAAPGKQNTRINYLDELSSLNMDVPFPENPQAIFDENNDLKIGFISEQVMNELDESDIKELKDKFNAFYIVVFDVDTNYAISKIELLMPNPFDKKAYMVDDLTELIGKSSVQISDEEYEVLHGDIMTDYETSIAAEYGIVGLMEQYKKGNEEN